jgi:hypothetical protein
MWQYAEDATGEDLFVMENEILALLNRVGFTSSSQTTLADGSTEGYFWQTPPQAMQQEGFPGDGAYGE